MNAYAHQITDELRSWLRAQLDAGCRPDDVLAAMRTSGWSGAAALHALREVLPDVEAPVEVLPPASACA